MNGLCWREITSVKQKYLKQFNYEGKIELPYLPNPSARAGYDTRSIFLSGI